MHRTPLARALLGLLLALAAQGCCKPKAGDGCRRGQAACLDQSNELSCQSGKFVAAPCRGPQGCSLLEGVVSCDVSGNQSGDLCSTDDDGKAACTPDQKGRVQCAGGAYQLLPCRGEGGCRSESGGVSCDTSSAEPADPCDPPPAGKENQACSVDQKTVLTCRKGRFQPDQPCRGPDGCKVRAGTPVCDVSVAAPGDPCGADIAGKHACSPDRRGVLTCKDGRFVEDMPCRGAKGCAFDHDKITCDPG